MSSGGTHVGGRDPCGAALADPKIEWKKLRFQGGDRRANIRECNLDLLEALASATASARSGGRTVVLKLLGAAALFSNHSSK